MDAKKQYYVWTENEHGHWVQFTTLPVAQSIAEAIRVLADTQHTDHIFVVSIDKPFTFKAPIVERGRVLSKDELARVKASR